MKTKTVLASDLTKGDTVLVDGQMQTIGNESVKSDFFGTLVCGQRFANGIELVLFPKWFQGKIVDYVRQVEV